MPSNLPRGFPAAMFATSVDEKPFYRAQLRALSSSITGALPKTKDAATRAHLEGARDEIARILDPKFAAPGTSSTSGFPRSFGEASCWPDYVVEP